MKRLALFALALAAVLGFTAPASAQAWPDKPVRIVVPYQAGGTVDLVARVLAQSLSEQTGTQFIVDNRAGASGAIGSDLVAKGSPDGYTLLVQSPTLLANALINRRVPYDPIRDFRPIAMLGSVPMVLTVHPSVPAKNLKEFMELARKDPKRYSFGTSALGSPMHLAQEALKKAGGLEIPIIIYKGTAGALNDALGGQISGMIDAIPSSAAHISSGKLKPLAVTTAKRIAALPNVPTVAESGYPDFEMLSWYGLWAPQGLPEPIAKKLEGLVQKAMASKAVNERLAPQNFDAKVLAGDQFANFLTGQLATYSRIVKDANITAE
ncbi:MULTISPECIES: Bug family tripartite tricarboxylate transporter substrate binding protein [Ramlibacter]|uniref:Tripartite tricarboxylate transporter substrate binding protein n=1 Tax=Ramlibacter pinisoli TaxID=2682844 RepID=A0A6N8J3G7_9BURK|nr:MULTISPECIES: tripartite tricarboxylate transporter substrate binding protein [Ramlibacter]MVQ32766.1 tripartite tricarboxylate transporter substrate binding protein [Ramlibacter pinisoli]